MRTRARSSGGARQLYKLCSLMLCYPRVSRKWFRLGRLIQFQDALEFH